MIDLNDEHSHNAATVRPPPRAARGAPLGVAFAAARAHLFAPREPGYQIFALDGQGIRAVHLPPSAGASLVVGRHERCDLLIDDPTVALRHVLVRAVRLQDESLALRVLDLATGSGFETEGHANACSVLAEGPLALRLGGTVIVGLPYGAPVGAALPPPVFQSAHTVPSMRRPPAPNEVVSAPPSRWHSRVTLVPTPSSCDLVEVGDEIDRRIVIASRAGRCELRRSVAALEAGLLLGRYSRCDEQAASLMGIALSRVHALVLHEGGADLAFDLASTNGIGHGEAEARVRRADLFHGERLVLAPRTLERVEILWLRRDAVRRPQGPWN